MMGGLYASLEMTFGGGKPARVTYGGGILHGRDNVDLREVMAQDAVTGAIRNIIDELGEHELAEIKQQITHKHARG